ncbi:MAG: hypothetical protein MZU95_09735 [Desulfomicrobium escambiense]|nr:hypothetical protein [Desulfomicrobium escambiense]
MIPWSMPIGRGVLEALGIGLTLTPKSLAARGNFCTLDPASGVITDRRAGRIRHREVRRAREQAQGDYTGRGQDYCGARQGLPVRPHPRRRRAGGWA